MIFIIRNMLHIICTWRIRKGDWGGRVRGWSPRTGWSPRPGWSPRTGWSPQLGPRTGRRTFSVEAWFELKCFAYLTQVLIWECEKWQTCENPNYIFLWFLWWTSSISTKIKYWIDLQRLRICCGGLVFKTNLLLAESMDLLGWITRFLGLNFGFMIFMSSNASS